MSINEKAISTTCDGGNMNWNAYVASAAGGSVSAHVDATNWVCIEGTGATGFSELCEFTCEYGYCPIGACYCTKMGPAVDTPDEDTEGYGTVGYPAAGMSSNYDGLCSFACNYVSIFRRVYGYSRVFLGVFTRDGSQLGVLFRFRRLTW